MCTGLLCVVAALARSASDWLEIQVIGPALLDAVVLGTEMRVAGYWRNWSERTKMGVRGRLPCIGARVVALGSE